MDVLLSFLQHHRKLILDHGTFSARMQIPAISKLFCLLGTVAIVDVIKEFLLSMILSGFKFIFIIVALLVDFS